MYLGRSKRIASPDQRIALHGLQRGCTTAPGDMPGYLVEVHHDTDWAHGGRTDITNSPSPADTTTNAHPRRLENAKTRRRHHRMATPTGAPFNGGTNDYHHPERLLPPDDDAA